MMSDCDYMKYALSLARRGMGFVNPNPMVGAVVVKNGRIIGEGCHQKYGQLHAERNAFANCTESPEGAVLYVTLEPCCHYGKTPPCTEAVVENKISRVVIGSCDPNPLVAGKGVEFLRRHGIEVVEGVLKDECDRLNEIFFYHITTGLPFVTLKYAMSLDGKIAAYTGKSKWITGETARADVQTERLRHSAIMVGVGTVIADDPQLTCRLENGRNPLRIICDTHLRTPLESFVVKTAKEIPTVIAVGNDVGDDRAAEYEALGCRIMRAGEKDGHVDIAQLAAELGEEKIDSILVEGGAKLNWAVLESGVVNRVLAYISPKILGGEGAKSPVAGLGAECPDNAFIAKNCQIKRLGDDFRIEGRLK